MTKIQIHRYLTTHTGVKFFATIYLRTSKYSIVPITKKSFMSIVDLSHDNEVLNCEVTPDGDILVLSIL